MQFSRIITQQLFDTDSPAFALSNKPTGPELQRICVPLRHAFVGLVFLAAVSWGRPTGRDTTESDSARHDYFRRKELRLSMAPAFSMVRVDDIGAHGAALEVALGFGRHWVGAAYVHDIYTPKTDDELELRGPLVKYRFEGLDFGEIIILSAGAFAGYLEGEYGHATPVYTSYGHYWVRNEISVWEDAMFYGGVGATADFGLQWAFVRIEYDFIVGPEKIGHMVNVCTVFRLRIR